jgi:hypothetical protein
VGAFLGGESIIINEDKTVVRRYLLGQLEEAEEERLELRLLTDASFIEEFDTVVDEITDQYAGDELQGEEQERVEKYFLRAAERQRKVQFARDLLQHAANEQAGAPDPIEPPTPGVFERISEFFRGQSIALRTATTIATLVVVVGLAFLFRPILFPTTGTDTLITLNLSASDRSSGTEPKSVKLDGGILKIELILPDQVPQEQSYRVELIDEQQRSRNLRLQDRTPKSLKVTIPADEITPGGYIIHLHGIKPDGTERRVPGRYFFNVE